MMSSNMENVAPNVLRTVIKQAQALVQEKMEGIHVLLNDDDMTDIQVSGRCRRQEGLSFTTEMQKKITSQFCPDEKREIVQE